MVDSLIAAATHDGVYAVAVERPDDRVHLAVAFAWADRVETADPDYQAERAHWTWHEGEAAEDGVPASAVPHAVPGSPRHPDLPVRDFEAGIAGGEALPDEIDEQPLYLVVFTVEDSPDARPRAGEAYARLSVEAERLGLTSSAMTQAVDLPAVRERFRTLMDWLDHPQMIVRIGWPQDGPAAGADPAPGSVRHPGVRVAVESSSGRGAPARAAAPAGRRIVRPVPRG
jgi:hypothetical protein